MKHTISIARYGHSDYIDALLASLAKNTLVDYEVFITDTKEPRISLAAAWNKGLERGNGEICTVLNDDTLVSRGWAGRLELALMEHNVGVVSPTLSVCANNQKRPFQQITQNANPDAYTQEMVDAFARTLVAKFGGQVQDLSILCGCCLTFRRTTWEAIGKFDEEFFPIYGEDDDFCDRIIAAGMRCVWVKDAYIHHFGRKTAPGVPELNRAFTSNLLKQKRAERARIAQGRAN
jgi:GT2 family glycosyltransferase